MPTPPVLSPVLSQVHAWSSLGLIDQVQHLRELDTLDPTRFRDLLLADLGPHDETLPTLGAQLEGLRHALAATERFAGKAMGIRLTHVLANAPVAPQLRTLLATTVTSYAGNSTLLRRRFGASLSAPLLDEIIAAAEQTVALWMTLRGHVLDRVTELAAAQISWLQRAARVRTLADAERRRLQLARVDLSQLAEKPERIAAASFEDRLKTYPPPEDEPVVEEPAPQRFSLLEID